MKRWKREREKKGKKRERKKEKEIPYNWTEYFSEIESLPLKVKIKN